MLVEFVAGRVRVASAKKGLGKSMQEAVPSRTALGTALMRARHTRLDPEPIFDDLWGDKLVPEAMRAAILQAMVAQLSPDERVQALTVPTTTLDSLMRTNSAYGNVILRTRYTEDALRTAVAAGVRQYVLIGAGFDSFLLRRPDFAAEVAIFEIDHPATQTFKIDRLQNCGLTPRSPIHLISTDLGHEELPAALARSPFRADQPAFFSWLGVTMYLTRAANLATLHGIARCAAPGSEVIFTYIDQARFDVPVSAGSNQDALHRIVASLGEPFISGFHPATLADLLTPIGFELIEDIKDGDIALRYGRTGAKLLETMETGHMAHLRVR